MRHEEFDSLGWPPKGRFGNVSAALKPYTDFWHKKWVENGLAWLVAPTLLSQQDFPNGVVDLKFG